MATCHRADITQVAVCNCGSLSQLNSGGLYIPMCVTQPCVDAFNFGALQVFAFKQQMWSFSDTVKFVTGTVTVIGPATSTSAKLTAVIFHV